MNGDRADAAGLVARAEFPDATPRGIAGVIARLVSSGELAPGERLPTVRDLAAALGVSPATVSQAWQALARAGMIESRGRAGSFVRGGASARGASARLAPRMRGMAAPDDPVRLDLSRGTPDPLLLPALGPALSRVSARAETGSYQAEPVIPALATVLADSWPSPAESIMVVDGALDAISRTLEQLVRFGDRVVVESPGFPPFLDLLDVLGAEAVPVRLDAHGMVPEALGRALRGRPAAVLLQPRAQNPTGASMTAERAEALAHVIRSAADVDDLVVIEDDHPVDEVARPAACSAPAGPRGCCRRSCSTCSPTVRPSTRSPRPAGSTTRGSGRSAMRCARGACPSRLPTASTCGCPC